MEEACKWFDGELWAKTRPAYVIRHCTDNAKGTRALDVQCSVGGKASEALLQERLACACIASCIPGIMRIKPSRAPLQRLI